MARSGPGRRPHFHPVLWECGKRGVDNLSSPARPVDKGKNRPHPPVDDFSLQAQPFSAGFHKKFPYGLLIRQKTLSSPCEERIERRSHHEVFL